MCEDSITVILGLPELSVRGKEETHYAIRVKREYRERIFSEHNAFQRCVVRFCPKEGVTPSATFLFQLTLPPTSPSSQ